VRAVGDHLNYFLQVNVSFKHVNGVIILTWYYINVLLHTEID
jgi:hypothetical protein